MNTSPNLYEAVMEHLRAKRVPQRTVARESGVPFSTLTKIAQGQIRAPSVHHVQALYDYFQKVGAGETAQPMKEAA
jgi:transcriptional regulator with XRE-family HTH domain